MNSLRVDFVYIRATQKIDFLFGVNTKELFLSYIMTGDISICRTSTDFFLPKNGNYRERKLWSKPILMWRTLASGFFLQSCDVSLLSKGQLWSVCMKLKQAAAIQRKVMLMVAAEERGTAITGGALHVFTSNGPFTLKLKNWRGWKDRRRNDQNKSEVLDQRRRGGQPFVA